MASTFSPLKIELIGTGEKVGTWGTTTNINLGTALEEAITGSADVTFASGTVTLTLTDVNTTQTARNLRLNLIGTSGGAQNLIVPAIEKLYIVNNTCADAITVKNSTGTGVAVPAGKSMFVYNNATNVVEVTTTTPSTIPNLTGDVTSVGTTTTLTNAPVIAKVLTGFSSTTGTVAAADSILTAFNKTTGNIALKANLASPTGTGTLTWPTVVSTDTTDASSSTTGAVKTAGGLGVAKKVYVGTDLNVAGQFNLTGDLIKTRSESGANSLISMTNSSNTANSGAEIDLVVGGTSAGDPFMTFSIPATSFISMGIDNSDSDKFKISNSLSLGTNDAFAVTAAGVVEIPTGMTLTGPITSSVPGTLHKGATNGFAIRLATGSANDLTITNAGATTNVLYSPTGTDLITIGGNFGRGAPVTKTADFTVATTENWLINNKAAATCTVTLPAAATYPGRELMFNNYQAFTVVSASSNVVPLAGGAAGTALLAATAGKWATLVSNGTNWVIMQAN